jgi:hypothetical protein
MGLSKGSMKFLDESSRGAFLHLSTSEARAMLDIPKKEKKSSPDQEEVLMAKSQPL